MVFSSHLFLFYFLPLALLLYYALPFRGRNLLLTLVSYVFYGWANPQFMLLMFASSSSDYVCGLVISGQFGKTWKDPVVALPRGGARTRRQRTALAVVLVLNLALLGFFKYFNFATDSYDALLRALGLGGLQLELAFRVTLPLGMSFYTFHAMSYAIDVYRGDAKAIRNFTDYTCYISLFPQLVAGPIIRFQEIADQLQFRTHTLSKFARGIAFFAVGMAKKILLANPCGKVADSIFDAGGASCLDSWYGVVGYAFQIYFDFSAYSDMALGLGLMLGFVFAKNFDSPYHSQSITEFWQRWHISLSTWLRDYLYIPLGGNRKGERRTYVNLALVMLLGGLWHGAAWNFVVWGGMHGTLLALERARGKYALYGRLPAPVRVALTFTIVLFTWVFFRSKDLASALHYCAAMLGAGAAPPGAALLHGLVYQPYYLGTMALCAVVTWTCPQTWTWTREIGRGKALCVIALFVLSVLVLTTQAYNPFIYFIF